MDRNGSSFSTRKSNLKNDPLTTKTNMGISWGQSSRTPQLFIYSVTGHNYLLLLDPNDEWAWFWVQKI